MKRIFLTDHAYMRMKERVGVGRKAAERLVSKAYEEGVGKDSARGSLHRYLARETRSDLYKDTAVKIYGEMVYCFMDMPERAVLVTVFYIPGGLKKQALGAQRKQAA